MYKSLITKSRAFCDIIKSRIFATPQRKMAKKEQKQFKKEDLKLPSRLLPNTGTLNRSMNFPIDLYEDGYKVCQALGHSINKVVVELFRDFVVAHLHLVKSDK